MAQTQTKAYKEKVMAKRPLAPDLELHVRVVKTDGLEMVDLRQFVLSQGVYGRGVMFEAQHLSWVIEELGRLHAHVGVGNGSRAPGKGQGKLL